MSINLYKNNYQQNITTFNTVGIDMTDLQEGDIIWQNNVTATYAPTGDIIHLLKFNIPLQGINRVTGYDPDPDSSENLCPRPTYTTLETGEGANLSYDIGVLPNKEPITIGEKPADWESKWPLYYYTRRTVVSGNVTYEIMDTATATWDSTAQYYRDTTQQVAYYTGSQGFFGVSRYFGYIYNGLDNTFREVISVGLPFGTRVHRPVSGNFVFKSAGMFGTPIFNTDVALETISQYTNPPLNLVTGLHYSTSKTLVQMCDFSYTVSDSSHDAPYSADFIGVVVIEMSPDDIPLLAYVVAVQKPFWTPIEKKSSGGPKSHAQGGQGTHLAPSDNYGDRKGATIAGLTSNWNGSLSVLGACQNRYRLDLLGSNDAAAFNDVINTLWSPNVWDAITNNFFNPKDAIIVCHLMPNRLGPLSNGGTSKIYAADKNLSTRYVSTFSDTFRHQHIGDIDIEVMRDAFPDFDDSAVYIHLPYVGVKQIDVTACMDGWLSVDYISDVMSGDITAMVTVCDTFGNIRLRYEYKGNCAYQFDLASRAKTPTQAWLGGGIANLARVGLSVAGSQIIAKHSVPYNIPQQVNLGGGKVVTGYKQDPAVLTATMTSARITSMQQGLNSILNQDADNCGVGTVASNANGGSVSSPIDTTCWVLVTRPEWSNPQGYDEMFGFPSDIGGVINDTFTGFLVTRGAFVDDLPATDEEKAEIMAILGSGVYLNKPTFTTGG